jgi:competence protein ComEC
VSDATLAALAKGEDLTAPDIDPVACPGCDPRIGLLKGRMSSTGNENDQSIVVRVDFGKASALFTGDCETTGLKALLKRYGGTSRLDTDLYHVGHHGAANATTPALVEAVTPRVAVISVGLPHPGDGSSGWDYGHPRKTVVRDLAKAIKGKRTPAIGVKVATGQREFGSARITKRIYATAWDGNVVVTMGSAGSISVSRRR